jgi:kynurenine formamidase
MKIFDLSHSVCPGMPVYPGDNPPVSKKVYTIDRDGFQETEMTLNTHLGAHLDVQAHVFQGGRTLDRIPVEKFLGSCCCIDLAAFSGSLIEEADLDSYRELISKNDFVLFNTARSRLWGSDYYFTGFPTLSLDAASWLAAFPLKGIGFDTISFDRVEDYQLPIHRILLERNICLIENLTGLESLPRDGFLFACFPVKIEGGDGFPVRAVALFL